jgi:hypothetical protein
MPVPGTLAGTSVPSVTLPTRSTPPPSVSPPPTVRPGTTTPPSTHPSTPTSVSGGSLELTDSDKGRTISVRTGAKITVVLQSTYWQFSGSSNPSVLTQQGGTVYAPAPGCVPGQGCGTATAQFVSAAVGQAQISASRTSCGEALRCTPDEGSYTVTIVVTA